ncbi:hypothetical protein ABB37_01181 [Leptomonas pyrrhocoris]|uniref:PPPDE domain-containing protein n=1 Tax=Leptomonas pyrrhocoris TaxID=157538 RepID=A0A0M9G834_LEPPY|nr:hypothetical protein ABB37_01181 [Leptomonas pyrrhocoris]KPA84670.1 hypothetical protein ABB37_01181 [Leptomonas pyrrhocoris]|eukprot:XP_015663109.1 hypothetical protein ABB37_01181 [Leptomonas pyrrhocoris]
MSDHRKVATSGDTALYTNMEHADPLDVNESVVLPPKAVPTPYRRPRDIRLYLSVSKESPESEHDLPLFTPLIMTEYSHGRQGMTAPFNSRRLSVTCIPVEAATASSAGASPKKAASSHTPISRVAALKPPNEWSVPGTAVRDCFSFVQDHCTQKSCDVEVELHVYDLSQGFLKKYSNELVGVETTGVYHSGIVCYGLEFYFEGGIGVTASGRTRFGTKYKKHRLGVTQRTVTEFWQWIATRALHVNQIHDYHPVRHNCHHFSNDALQYLVGVQATIPQYLFDTVNTLVKTPLGAAVAEAMTLTTRGIQSVVSRQMLSRVVERQCSVDMQLSASTACGVLALPPTAAVVFRVVEPHFAKRLLMGISPFLKGLIAKKLVKPAALEVLEQTADALVDAVDTIPPRLILNYVEMIVESLLRSPMTTWGPIFNSLRIAVLHRVCLITCAFHPKLLSILVLAARDFPRLLPDGRVAMLRLLCNLACSTHGAIIYTDGRYRDSWVSLVGLGLMDASAAVVYTAACLALNLSHSIVITTNPSLKRDMSQLNDEHYALRLVTLLLYNLRFRSAKQLPEPSFNMALLALYRLMSSNAVALEYVVYHSFKPHYSELLDRCESNESRALVCLIKTIENLFG